MTTATAKAPATPTESPLRKEQLDAVRQLDGCTIANAIETFGVRLATEGFADSRIRCIFPNQSHMLGYAVTGRIHACSVPMAGQPYCDRTGWWEYILSTPAPRVVVLQDMSDRPGLGAFLGEVHSAILTRLGCVGAVTNGAVRDLPAVEAMGFAFFAGNIAISHCFAHLVDFGQPVELGGLHVRPGDLVYGDSHGVLTVPTEVASRIPEAAARLAARERCVIELCRSADFSIDKLRAMLCR